MWCQKEVFYITQKLLRPYCGRTRSKLHHEINSFPAKIPNVYMPLPDCIEKNNKEVNKKHKSGK